MYVDKGQHSSQTPQFLVFTCDLNDIMFKIPVKKLEHILSEIGKIMARSKGIGHVTRIMLRSCYAGIDMTQERFGWDWFDSLSEEAVEELSWWREHLGAGRLERVHNCNLT